MHAALLAEFRTPEAMLEAIRALRQRGYTKLDAFMPYPVHGVQEALGLGRSFLSWAVLALAIGGASAGYFVQWWCNAYDYPLNVGGRPFNSAPAFIPITFEMGILAAAVGGILLFFVLAKFPELYHPVFDVPGFERASIDRFWVAVDERDPAFDSVALERELTELGALQVAFAGGRR